jgi:outer membrane receptor protein involved in Fe transport
VSAGWNISEEEFLKGVPAIDKLKLRVGYGETSNQSINPYATLGELSTRFYNFGPTNFQTGYYVSSLPNPNLGWEYSETWNFGVDFTLLKNRLTGTVEYYVQNTKDVLLGLSLPRTSGVSGSYYANIGQTQNKGVEFSLNGVILDNLNGFTWEAGVNFYANRNKLVALASGQERDEGNWWFVGYPIDVIYDYEYDGLWQEGDPYLAELEPGGNVGMIKVKHTLRYDGEGKLKPIGADDRQIISMEPNFQGGFNTRLEWKGLELGLVGAFKNGGKLISTLYSTRGYLNQLTGRRNQVSVDYWTPQNTGAKYPKPGGMEGAAEGPKYGDSLGYFDASYVKIRTITLGYSIGRKWTTAIGVDRLRLYATVQNPFVMFSPYHSETGLDPEPNSYGDENLASNNYNSRLLIVGTNAPATRSYLFGINLTF